jgi:hypothetical protein
MSADSGGFSSKGLGDMSEHAEGLDSYAALDSDIAWYETHASEIAVIYPTGTFLAIIDRVVVDFDVDLIRLGARMQERFGTRSIFVPEVGEVRPELAHFRSPRSAR